MTSGRYRLRSSAHPMGAMAAIVERLLGVAGTSLLHSLPVVPHESVGVGVGAFGVVSVGAGGEVGEVGIGVGVEVEGVGVGGVEVGVGEGGGGGLDPPMEDVGQSEYTEEADIAELLRRLSDHVPPPLEADTVERIHAFCTNHQQETTRKSYNRSVRLYLEFWIQRGISNAEVTPEGVALFLGGALPLGFATLNQYLKGLVDFHKQQCYEKQVPYNSLRNDPLIGKILVASKKVISKRKYEMLSEGEAKATSEITPAQVIDLSKYLLQGAAKEISSLMGFTPYVGLQVRYYLLSHIFLIQKV